MSHQLQSQPVPLAPLSVVDTRHFFRPVSTELVSLLRTLPAKDWLRQTTAKAWLVRDVVAHLTDGALRRLSAQRDGLVLPPPPDPIRADREFVGFINTMNAEGVSVGRRYSTHVLT